MEKDKLGRMIGYAIVAEEVAVHLPPDVEPWVLRDPPLPIDRAA
jgi:hypothetical protein